MATSRPTGGTDLEHAREIERALEGFRRVILSAHVRPDGDAVGSLLGFAAILRAREIEAEIVLQDEVPPAYLFLAGAEEIKHPSETSGGKGAAFLALDTTSAERLGGAGRVAASCAKRIVVDHHVSNGLFGDANWVDPRASSVGEMAYRFARALGWEVPEEALSPLYVAIVTDTGRFVYSNTTPASMRIAGDLVARGVDPARVASFVYGNRTPGQWELVTRARLSLVIEPDGRIATLGVTTRDFEETGTRPVDTQDLPALARTLAGVDLGMFFYEIDRGRRTRVNVRTTGAVDADKFAGRFGGGGHRQAAGCAVDGDLGEVRRKVLAEARTFLEPPIE